MIRLEMEWNIPEDREASSELLRAAEACARMEGVDVPLYAHLLITDNDEIHRFNREYRGVDRPTDVLSFPSLNCRPEKTLGRDPKQAYREIDESGDCFLGDVILSLPMAQAQALEYGHSLKREMTYLTVHALCHLMGYDHMIPEDQRRMRAMEEKILGSIGISRVTDEELMATARKAMEFSYSPYSHYRVGAALLSAEGQVFTGCNIENGSYGASNCAERTALFKAVSEGVREFTAIAIAAEKAAPWPCGICRQALNEFAPDLRVIVTWDGQKAESTLPELLPHAFGPKQGTLDFLGKE